MARRTLNRKDLRAQAEAAERAEDTEEKDEEEEEEEEDEESDDEDAGEEDEDAGEEEDDEQKPKAKKKKAPAKPKPKPKATKPRKSRTAKTTRMKVVWGVFNNSHARVASFDYPRRAEANALAAKLTADKKSTHFVQPVKEPMEEKKDE